ncbi:MAG: MFS transporter [Acidobacteriota bacterium]|nr:MFS transporter [Acidobacteriota bacterium]
MTAALPVAVTARRKIVARLQPFLFAVYFIAFLDRVNIGYAGLEMTKELHFSNQVFGFGAGIFFVGFVLMEIPGAMLAQYWSVRRLLAAILITWGLFASLTGLIQSATQFNIIRFIVGMAEGGLFPAIIVYLTHWCRQEDRGKAIAAFMIAGPFSLCLGGIVSGALLNMHWPLLSGWRWMLILEGLPSLLIGIFALVVLSDWPHEAKWLTQSEKDWIEGELELEHQSHGSRPDQPSFLKTVRQRKVLLLAACYFFINCTTYSLTFWLPKIVQKFGGLSNWQIGLITSIPYLCSVPASLSWGWHSDKTGERRGHAAIALVIGASGLAASQISGISPVLSIACFTVAIAGLYSFYPCFWPIPTQLLAPREAAAAIGFIALGNLGGFAGPYALGWLTDATGSYVAGILLMVSCSVTAAAILYFVPRPAVRGTTATAMLVPAE